MLNWRGWAANFLGWGSEGVDAPVVVAPAGSGVRNRPRPRVYVEIDDQLFPVSSEAEAVKLLAKAKQTAKEVVKQVKADPKLPKVEIPIVTAKGSERLEKIASEAQTYIAQQYKKARAIQEDDDDIEVLLLSL
jgi:hypothetical protein